MKSYKLAVQARYRDVWCKFNTRRNVYQICTRVYQPSRQPGCFTSSIISLAESTSARDAWQSAARNLGV